MNPARPFRLKSPKPPKLVEKQVIDQCKDWLGLRGYYCQRNHVGLFRTPDLRWIRVGVPGSPDYLAAHGIYPSFWIEFKRPGGELDPNQWIQFEAIRQGYRMAVVKVDRLEVLIEWLPKHESAARRQWQELLSRTANSPGSACDRGTGAAAANQREQTTT